MTFFSISIRFQVSFSIKLVSKFPYLFLFYLFITLGNIIYKFFYIQSINYVIFFLMIPIWDPKFFRVYFDDSFCFFSVVKLWFFDDSGLTSIYSSVSNLIISIILFFNSLQFSSVVSSFLSFNFSWKFFLLSSMSMPW